MVKRRRRTIMATKRTSSYNHRKYLRPASEFPACGAQKALLQISVITRKKAILRFFTHYRDMRVIVRIQ